MNVGKHWHNLPLRLKTLAVVTAPLVILLIALALFVNSETEQQEEETWWLNHTFQVRKEIRQILSDVLDAEMGVREYIETGRREALRPYEETQAELPRHLSHLRTFVREDLGQAPKVAQIEPALHQILNVLGALVATPAVTERSSLLETSKRGIDELRLEFKALMAEEEQVLQARQYHRRQAIHVQYTELAATVVVALAAGWFAVLLLTNNIVCRVKHLGENTKRLSEHQPLLPTREGNDEIGRVEKALQAAAALVARRERELRESEEQFREMAEHVEDVFFMFSNEDEKLLYVNHAYENIWGLSREGFYADRWQWLEAIHPDDQQRVRHVITTGDVPGKYDVEYRVVRPDKSFRWIRERGFPIKNEAGNYYRTASLATDVTERREAETIIRDARDQADHANKAKSDFLSRMSHELRTPLNAILGFGQLLEMNELRENQRTAVSHILSGGRHLLDLINEVLDISRIEAGRMTVSLEPVCLQALLNDLLILVRPLAQDRKVQLVNRVESTNLLYVVADRQRLKQVLLNLLSNAIKYNRAGGAVAVDAFVTEASGQAKNQMLVEIKDTGIGIAPEALPRMFTPFDRLGAERSQVEGTGLGLALSKRLLELMGGSIEVHSEQGVGSTFTLRLEATQDPSSLQQKGDHEAEVVLNPSEITVLYVEDNLSNFKLLQHLFSERGNVTLIEAMQGGIGLELAREHRPDLVLLDLHLPDMDGGELLQRLRADERTASIPVIIISADATRGQIDRLTRLGAEAYLTKPINIRELLTVLNRTLAKTAATV